MSTQENDLSVPARIVLSDPDDIRFSRPSGFNLNEPFHNYIEENRKCGRGIEPGVKRAAQSSYPQTAKTTGRDHLKSGVVQSVLRA